MVKAVRAAKVARRLHKYNVDANGRCFVQLDNRGSPWKEVTSKDSLETMLSQRSFHPLPALTNFQQHGC